MLKTSKAALLAAMLSFSVLSVASLPAYAQDLSLEQEAEADTDTPPFTIDYSVPSIVLGASSMNETSLREVFEGNIEQHAEALASLDAQSITIPEITVAFSATSPDIGDSTGTFVIRDLVFADVVDGVVGRMSIRQIEMRQDQGSVKSNDLMGELVMEGLNLRRALEFIGLVEGDPNASLATLYTSFTGNGSSTTSSLYSCEMGSTASRETFVRPSAISFAAARDAFMTLVENEDAEEFPAEAGTVMLYAFDLFRGIAGGGGVNNAMSCTFDVDGLEGRFGIQSIETSDLEPGVYPNLAVNGLSVDAGEFGTASLGQFVLKPIDFNGAMDAIQSGIEEGSLSDDWFEANARALIPYFAGFSFEGFALDMVNFDNPAGDRIVANVGSFDLTLDDYLNGIPTSLSSSAAGIDVPVPEDASDPTFSMLHAVGIDRVAMGFDFAAAWDEDSSSIGIDRLALILADLANVSIKADIGNATVELFDTDTAAMEAAAAGLTVKNVTVTYTDEGIGEIAWPILAAQQGTSDVDAFRTQMGGFAEGLALQMLGSTDAARQLGMALSEYVTGAKQTVTVEMKAKDPAGIPLSVFTAAQDNPTVLLSQLDITGSAN